MELQLKVKHFIQVLKDGTIKITNFVDKDCGCVVERAVIEQLNVPLSSVEEAIIRLDVYNIDHFDVYYHELYDSTRFQEDSTKAKSLINEPDSIIRTLNLTKPYEL